MELAINYSPAAEDLVRSGIITVDRFKCPDWPGLIGKARACRPVYVHFPLHAGRCWGKSTDLDEVGRLMEATGTCHVNTHLDPEVEDGDEAAALARTIRDVEMLVRHFGAAQVVVENVPFWQYESPHHRLAVQPAFISEVVRATGCGFLLDLSHARIAARELGRDEQDYIAALPVDRLRELHVTGLARHGGRLGDHMPLRESDWRAVTWALKQVHDGAWGLPRIVAFEYGGVGARFAWRSDAGVMAGQVPRLYEMVHVLDRVEEGTEKPYTVPDLKQVT